MSFLRNLFRPSFELRAEEFWTWFAANEHVYTALHTQPAEEIAHSMHVMVEHLARVHAEVFPLVGRAQNGSGSELTISAGGQQQHFALVHQLVEAAPAVPGWAIYALVQPRVHQTEVMEGDHSLLLSDVRFARVTLPDRPEAVALQLVLPPYPPAEQALMERLSGRVLKVVLGEEAAATRIDALDVTPQTADIPEGVLRQIEALGRALATP